MAYTQLADPIAGTVRSDTIKRDRDGAIVPADPHNTDWQAYLAWRDAGNAPAPPPGAPPVAPKR